MKNIFKRITELFKPKIIVNNTSEIEPKMVTKKYWTKYDEMALNNKYDDDFIKFSLKITEREKEYKKIAHEKKN